MGADVVEGIPHYESAKEFGEKSIHDIVKLALKYDKLIGVYWVQQIIHMRIECWTC